MSRKEQRNQSAVAWKSVVRLGIKRIVWRAIDYYFPLQEERFSPDIWRMVQGAPVFFYRSLIPAGVLAGISLMAAQGVLTPGLDIPTFLLSLPFCVLTGMMTCLYFEGRK